ncbi:MAG: hypothetical protein HN849_27540, partial [Victivallales bacterium]|nr:hypothetical protein [Victivallales bacterium]
DGSYQLLVRGASEHETIDREIQIDATPFPIPDAMVRMQGTGGWCRAQDDWAWNAIADPEGTPASISLKKGPHTLRWNYINGSQNLDLLVLRPVPQP